MTRSTFVLPLLFAVVLTALPTGAHAQVMPSSSGGNVVVGTPAPEPSRAWTSSQFRFTGMDLTAVRSWLRAALVPAVRTTPAAAPRVRHGVRERDVRGAL